MPIYSREKLYLDLLSEKNFSIKELSEKLFVSEPTVRRDVKLLKERELIKCNRGIVSLQTKYADKRIPLFIRETEYNEAKKQIAIKASKYVKDGDVIMLDASTTSYHILPYLKNLKNILIITNGAKTALHSVSLGIKTMCSGGDITPESFSFIGHDAEKMLKSYNADIAFFSCRGITSDGIATDNSIYENSIRRIMIENSKKKILLCDKSKFDHKYLHTLCNKNELTDIISD